jgi:hypothetical protein
MAEKTVMDAMNAALGSAASGDPDENAGVAADDAETPVQPESGGDTDPGDELGEESTESGNESEGGDEGAGEGESSDGTLTTASAAITSAEGNADRNPDGTFKKKGEEPKKADPVNDPIPKDLKVETRARMQTLIDTAKEVTAKYEKAQQDFDYLIQGVQATGATPEQYGEALSWLGVFNSGDPKQQERALELVESVAERLATLLGKERVVGDPLAQHADLKNAVASKQITPEYAKEIARVRNGQAFRTEINTSAQQQQQTQQQAAQTLQTARNDLTALEENLRAVDGAEYDAIKAQIVGPLKPLMAAINPAQWKAKFTEAYKAAKDARVAAKATRTVAPKVPTNQPLRGGKNPAGGQARAPASAGEAMNAALASMK